MAEPFGVCQMGKCFAYPKYVMEFRDFNGKGRPKATFFVAISGGGLRGFRSATHQLDETPEDEKLQRNDHETIEENGHK